MSNKYYGDDDLIFNTSVRLPVCFLIDTSSSMWEVYDETNAVDTGETIFADGKNYRLVTGGKSYIGDLVTAVNKFYEAIKGDEQAKRSCEISIVLFSDDVKVDGDFETVDKKKEFLEPTEGNNTNLGAAVMKALDMLEKRKAEYKKTGVDYFQPWLVIFTDGVSSDDVTEAQKRCMEMINNGKLVVFPFGISDKAGLSQLKGFSNKTPLKIKDTKIEDCFEWLFKSASVVSKSKPGDKVSFDVSNFHDMFDL